MPIKYIKQPRNVKGPGFSFDWNPDFAKTINNRLYEAQKVVDSEYFRYSKPYMPFRTGAFMEECQRANSSLAGTGWVVYVGPIAEYLHTGLSKNKRLLKFNGAPKRGRYWTKRTEENHGGEIRAAAQKAFDAASGQRSSPGMEYSEGAAHLRMLSAANMPAIVLTDERINMLLSPKSPADRGVIALDYTE